jgi:hypothetical protein
MVSTKLMPEVLRSFATRVMDKSLDHGLQLALI